MSSCRHTRQPHRRLPVAVAAALLLGVWSAVAAAQYRDSFEGPEPTWLLGGADCGVKVLGKQRDYRQAHAGQASENHRLSIGNGTHVYLVLPIGKVPVIEEFRPSLYLKADRASLHFMARVAMNTSTL
jgi:hypothetical protein